MKGECLKSATNAKPTEVSVAGMGAASVWRRVRFPRAVVLFLLLAFTFSYFHQGGGFNQNATIGEIRALVEQHTVEITSWLPVTGDVSSYHGKTYSNKSPSVLFFVAPVYALVYHGAGAFGIDTAAAPYQSFATHLLTFLCAGLWAVLLALLYLKLLPLLFPEVTVDDSYWLAYALTIGTMVFPYSGAAFVHNFEAFTAICVYYQLLRLPALSLKAGLARLGLASGLMMLANPLTVLAMPVVFLCAWRQYRGLSALVRLGLWTTLPLLPLLLYNQLVFDFFLSGNRNHLDPHWTDPKLLMGVFDWPDWRRLNDLFGSGLRSLYPTQIFLYLGLIGLFGRQLGRQLGRHDAAFGRHAFPVAIFCVYLTVMLTFNGWHGGSCFGPRYFITAMAFLSIASVPFFLRYRTAYNILVSWSMVAMLGVSIATLWISETDTRPFHTVLGALKSVAGKPFMIWPSYIGAQPPFNKYNLGNIIGLDGWWSLAPLLLAHAVALPYILQARLTFGDAPVHGKAWTRIQVLLAAGVAALIGARLLWPNFTPFINDEAVIQLRISEFLRGGAFPRVGLNGSQPIPYGPIPTWIYLAIRLLADHHVAVVIGHALTHVVALGLLWGLFARLFQRRVALLTMALAASSPFLFNYARVPWDNTFLFLFSTMMVTAVAAIVGGRAEERWPWLVLGFASGLSIGTHLMVLPFVASSYGIAVLFGSGSATTPRSRLVKAALSGAALLLTISPYVVTILPLIGKGGPQGHWTAARHVGVMLERLPVFLSFSGFTSYFFGGVEQGVLDALTPRLRTINNIDTTWLLKASVLLIVAVPLWRLRGGWRTLWALPPMLVYAALTAVLLVMFYAYAGHYVHPHYYNYVWWLPFLGVGYLLDLNWRLPRLLLRVAVVAVVLVNLEFLAGTATYLWRNEGIRGLGWGATAANQKQVLGALCLDARERGRKQVRVNISQVVILPSSLEFLAQDVDHCRGMALSFSGDGDYMLHYPSGLGGVTAVPPGSAHLEFQWLGPTAH